MFGFPHRSTRAALLIETEEDGEKKILIYQMGMPLSVSVDHEYNIWDFRDGGTQIFPHSSRVTIEAYLSDPRAYGHEFPISQEEIEPAQLAIESNESEIIIDEEGFEAWQQED